MAKNISSKWLLVIASMTLTVAAGCMLGPDDGRDIKSRTQRINFGGATMWANDPITVQALNRNTNQWTTIGSTTAAPDGQPDTDGYFWHEWAKWDVALPSSTSYWQTTGTGTGRKSTITTRSVSQNAGGTLTTFTKSAQQCIVAEALVNDANGLELIENCGTGNTVRLDVPCGDRMEACCVHSPGCNSPLVCNNRLCADADTRVDEDGIIDEMDQPCSAIAGGPCMAPAMGCYSGVTSVPATIKCVNGQPVCKATLGTDYCDNCSPNDGVPCGGCPGEPCQFDSECGPASFCNTYPMQQGGGRCESHDCQEKRDYCWLPKAGPMDPPPMGARSGDACARPL